MGETQNFSTSPAEQRWLDVVVSEMQVVNGLILLADPVDTPTLLRTFVDRIPVPVRATERPLLRGLLLEFAFRWGTRLRAGAHAGQPAGCEFHGTTFLEEFLNDRTRDARVSFAAWIDRFFLEFRRTHPPSTAVHAARLLRQRYARLVPVPTLARECHTAPVRLARDFRGQFGMSIPHISGGYGSSKPWAACVTKRLKRWREASAIEEPKTSIERFARSPV